MTSKQDRERLKQKLAEILAAGVLTEEMAVAELTEVIGTTYNIGLQTGLPLVTVSPLVTEASIQKAAKSMGERVGYIWNFMGRQISDTIQEGIKAGHSYDEISADVSVLLRETWGDEISFDNRGNVIKRVTVNPFTGEMEWENHSITETKTMKTEDFATTISQTTVHESWNKARDDQYDRIGLKGWVYSSVCDAATRPDHLAMHGTIIKRHSSDEAKAEKLMADYNCRCIKLPYWDDPELDTSSEVYKHQKQKAAAEERKQTPDGTSKADTLDAILGESKEDICRRIIDESETKLFGSKAFNKRLAELPAEMGALTKGTKSHSAYIKSLSSEIKHASVTTARLKNMGIRPEELAEQMTETLDKNFAYSQKDGYTYIHIFAGHGKEAFTLGDVITANRSQDTYIDKGKPVKLQRINAGHFLKVITGVDEDKVDKAITAHIIREKDAKKIMGGNT